jgi:hypothetical protein
MAKGPPLSTDDLLAAFFAGGALLVLGALFFVLTIASMVWEAVEAFRAVTGA